MNKKYPNPWDFANTDKNLVSPDGKYKIELDKLQEIAMGAPIGCQYFVVIDNKRIKLSDFCGGL